MRLIFSGTFPVWLVPLFFLAAAAFTWHIYRRYRLPRPWSWVLPLCRTVAFALLLMTLLQPVLARVWKEEVRGKLPVVVDTSGSMSIVDSYTTAQQIEAAWHLGLFPPDLRNRAFELMQDKVRQTGNALVDLAGLIDKNAAAWAAAGSLADEAAKSLREAKRQARELAGIVEDQHDDLADSIADAEYLRIDADPAKTRGRITCDRYDGVPGWEVADLTKSPKFPNTPDTIRQLSALQLPPGTGDSFGVRIRGILHPPQSGKYTFMITADDQAQLFLSDGPDPARKQMIAQVKEWVKPLEFDRFPEQKSAPVDLASDKEYYLEILFKENTGDDHCTVGWVLPDGTVETPVPGAGLSPLAVTTAQTEFNRRKDVVLQELKGAATETRGLADMLDKLAEPPADRARADEVERAKAKLQEIIRLWTPRAETMVELQGRADEALAGAGIHSVDAALAKLNRMPRIKVVQHLLTKSALKLEKLRRLADVDVFTLGEPVAPLSPKLDIAQPDALTAKLPASRVASTVYDVINYYGNQPISGVLLLSDGNNNAGKAFAELQQVLRERDVPVFSVGIGLPKPPRDVSIDHVLAPTTSFKGDTLKVTAVIRRHGFESRPIHVQVHCGNELLSEKDLPPGAESIVALDLSFIEKADGLRHYVVTAEHFGQEVLEINNRKSFSVNIMTDPVKALLVDEFPRWESRYANMMLKRDPRIDVRTVFIGSTPNLELPTGDDGFPADREGLFAFQILVLGDVNPAHFTPAQLDAIRAFVIEKGGTLLMMAGPSFMPAAYGRTALADMLPFRAQPVPVLPAPTAAAAPVPTLALAVTEGGRYENPVQIGPTPAVTAQLWEGLPGMNWVKEGVFANPNAETLVIVKDSKQPVVLTAYAGLGKVMYMGSDSFWRWRYRARWKYHHRLWGQVLLWATVGRTSGTDEHVKLMTDRAEYSPGETVTLKARVLNTDKQPLEGGTVSAEVRAEDGTVIRNVQFVHLANSGGEYRAMVRDLARGKYTVVPRVLELDGIEVKADYTFEVRDLPTSEYIELALDEAALTSISTEYRHFLKAEELVDKLPRISLKVEKRREFEVWDSFFLLAIVAALLGFEWHMRKKQNLV